MKVRVEYGGRVLEYDKPPMRTGRFNALCGLFKAGCYFGMVAAVAASCGLPGLLLVGLVSIFALALYLMTI